MRRAALAAALLLAATPCRAGKTKAAPADEPPAKDAWIWVSTAAALPTYAASSAPLTVGLVLERFERFDRAMGSLSADFLQFVRWDDSGLAQSVEGRLEYRRPDRLRVEQSLPEAQTVVSDGASLWIFRPSTNQVIKTRLESWKKKEPLARGLLEFGGYADLLKKYEVRLSTVSAPGKDGHRELTLSLKPKDRPDEFELKLYLSTRDYFPVQTELRVGGVTVRSRYARLRFNPDLSDARFRFQPPRGADLFQDDGP